MTHNKPDARLFRKTPAVTLTGVAVVLSLFSATTAHAAAGRTVPDIILVLVDDQGWTGSSVSMHPEIDAASDFHRTPNLERLARTGMRFTQGYSPAGLCCPTRRSIQFGQTPLRQGDDAAFASRYPIHNDRPTIPRVLKSVDPNFAAAHFGKWDLRTDLEPQHLGYDESDGNTRNGEGSMGDNGAADPITREEKWRRYVLLNDPKRAFSITDRATDFIRRMTAAERPFFLQVSHYAVHADFQTRAATFQKYSQLPVGKRHRNVAFAAMTEDLDVALGRLLDQLDELGIAEKTYVFYMADNGGVPWIPPNNIKHLTNPSRLSDRGRNHPLRAGKWTVFEGGIRVPFLVRGPGVKPGTVCNVPVVGWDLLSTINDLVGGRQELPEDIDGVSFKQLLHNGGQGRLERPHGLAFHRYSDSYGHSAIRVGNYKLVRFWKAPLGLNIERNKLFDLSRDLGETENLAAAMPDKVNDLETQLVGYLNLVSSKIAGGDRQ